MGVEMDAPIEVLRIDQNTVSKELARFRPCDNETRCFYCREWAQYIYKKHFIYSAKTQEDMPVVNSKPLTAGRYKVHFRELRNEDKKPKAHDVTQQFGEDMMGMLDACQQWMTLPSAYSGLPELFEQVEFNSFPDNIPLIEEDTKDPSHMLDPLIIERQALSLPSDGFYLLKNLTSDILLSHSKPMCEHTKPEWKTPSDLEMDRAIFNENASIHVKKALAEVATALDQSWQPLNEFIQKLKDHIVERNALIGGEGCQSAMDSFFAGQQYQSFVDYWTAQAPTYTKGGRKGKGGGLSKEETDKLDQMVKDHFDALKQKVDEFFSVFVMSHLDKIRELTANLWKLIASTINEMNQRIHSLECLKDIQDEFGNETKHQKMVDDGKLKSSLDKLTSGGTNPLNALDGGNTKMMPDLQARVEELKADMDQVYANYLESNNRIDKLNNKEFKKRVKKMESGYYSIRQHFRYEVTTNIFPEPLFCKFVMVCLESLMQEGELLEGVALQKKVKHFMVVYRDLLLQRHQLLSRFEEGVQTGRRELAGILGKLFLKEGMRIQGESLALKRQNSLLKSMGVPVEEETVSKKKKKKKNAAAAAAAAIAASAATSAAASPAPESSNNSASPSISANTPKISTPTPSTTTTTTTTTNTTTATTNATVATENDSTTTTDVTVTKKKEEVVVKEEEEVKEKEEEEVKEGKETLQKEEHKALKLEEVKKPKTLVIKESKEKIKEMNSIEEWKTMKSTTGTKSTLGGWNTVPVKQQQTFSSFKQSVTERPEVIQDWSTLRSEVKQTEDANGWSALASANDKEKWPTTTKSSTKKTTGSLKEEWPSIGPSKSSEGGWSNTNSSTLGWSKIANKTTPPPTKSTPSIPTSPSKPNKSTEKWPAVNPSASTKKKSSGWPALNTSATTESKPAEWPASPSKPAATVVDEWSSVTPSSTTTTATENKSSEWPANPATVDEWPAVNPSAPVENKSSGWSASSKPTVDEWPAVIPSTESKPTVNAPVPVQDKPSEWSTPAFTENAWSSTTTTVTKTEEPPKENWSSKPTEPVAPASSGWTSKPVEPISSGWTKEPSAVQQQQQEKPNGWTIEPSGNAWGAAASNNNWSTHDTPNDWSTEKTAQTVESETAKKIWTNDASANKSWSTTELNNDWSGTDVTGKRVKESKTDETWTNNKTSWTTPAAETTNWGTKSKTNRWATKNDSSENLGGWGAISSSTTNSNKPWDRGNNDWENKKAPSSTDVPTSWDPEGSSSDNWRRKSIPPQDATDWNKQPESTWNNEAPIQQTPSTEIPKENSFNNTIVNGPPGLMMKDTSSPTSLMMNAPPGLPTEPTTPPEVMLSAAQLQVPLPTNLDELGTDNLILLARNMHHQNSQLTQTVYSMQQEITMMTRRYSDIITLTREKEQQTLQLLEARRQTEIEEARRYVLGLEARIQQLTQQHQQQRPRRKIWSKHYSLRCGNCGQEGHASHDCTSLCRYCGSSDHLADECPNNN